MPDCTICLTHRYGRQLDQSDWRPVPGPVSMYCIYRKNQRRWVNCLTVEHFEHGGAVPTPIKHRRTPDLMDVELLSFCTERAFMVRGFEEIDGARYYQTWYITWDR